MHGVPWKWHALLRIWRNYRYSHFFTVPYNNYILIAALLLDFTQHFRGAKWIFLRKKFLDVCSAVKKFCYLNIFMSFVVQNYSLPP